MPPLRGNVRDDHSHRRTTEKRIAHTPSRKRSGCREDENRLDFPRARK